MRIDELEYWDRDSGWRLEPTKFLPDLTLLVGVSGVGKTKILTAIRNLKNIVRGEIDQRFFWGVSWRLQFEISGNNCVWQGKFDKRPESENANVEGDERPNFAEELSESSLPKFAFEHLTVDGKDLFQRDRDSISFEGNLTPKLSSHDSVLSLLREEESLAKITAGFDQIACQELPGPEPFQIYGLDQICRQYKTLVDIRNSGLATDIKLSVLFQNDLGAFNSIVSRFRDFFPSIGDVKIQRIWLRSHVEICEVRFKEEGMTGWISENQLSSGMLRTFMHVACMALWPDGSVILIDEFENSLGVNCLDEVTSDMMGERRRLQFIVTSHHPYIINNVPPKHWKLVTRSGSNVRTVDAADAGIGKSHHQAFVQLMNSPLYQDGIAPR